MKKNKDFFNKILISISTLFYSLSNFVFVYLLTRNMLPEEYGKLNSILIYGTLISLVLINGVDQVIMRYFYTKNLKKILRNYFYIFILLNIILITLVCLVYYITTINLLLLLIYSNFLTTFRIFNIIIRMKGNSLSYAFYNVFSKIIEFLLLLSFIYMNNLNFKTAIYSYILSIIIATIILLFFINLENGIDKNSYLSFNNQISYALPMFVAVIVTTLSQNIDKMILPFFVSSYKVGIYFSAFKLTSSLMIIQSIFSLIWIPNIIRKYEKNEILNITKVFNYIQSLIVILVIIFLWFNDFIANFLGKEFIESKTILPVLILVPCFTLLSEIGSIGISLKEKSKIHMLNSLIYLIFSGITTVLLSRTENLLLISCGVTFSTYIFYLLRTYIGTRLLRLKINSLKFELINFTLFVIVLLKIMNFNFLYMFSSFIILFVVFINILRRYQ